MARILLWLFIVWVLEVFLIAAFVRESWFNERIQQETDLAVNWLGADTVRAVHDAGDRIFQSAFVETGLYDTSFELFIPSEAERRRARGMEDMGKEIFRTVDTRIQVLWMAIYQVIIRVLMLLLWAPYFLIVLVPAIVDGVMVREIKKVNIGFASPAVHRYSLYLIGMASYVMLLTLFSPFNVNPIVYPVAIMIVVFAMHFVVSNTQKRL